MALVLAMFVAVFAAPASALAEKPAITEISPKEGPVAGGTTVTITGTSLGSATEVKFGSATAKILTNTETSITAESPAGTGTVDVTVTTAGGTSATGAADRFSYMPRPPAVTKVSPTEGPESGTTVTISGTNLEAATGVKFGSATAKIVTDSENSITAESPAGTGTVDVTVTTAGGTSATGPADRFTYVPPPTVTKVSPKEGPTAGATPVTITGTNLGSASAVKFGSSNAKSFTVNLDGSITAESPAGAGTVDVTVTAAGGTSATGATDQFSYVSPPTVTKVSPAEGPEGGTTAVTITGSNLTGASAVKFGSTNAKSFTVNLDGSITAESPAGTGTVDVTVSTAGGTSATGMADRFTYVPQPTVTAVSPREGPTAGGTTVTITGTGLSGATAVQFGSSPATSFKVVSDTSITAVAPAGTGTVHVTVTTPGGTSTTGPADQFVYVSPTTTPPKSTETTPPATTASSPPPPPAPTKVTLALISNLRERLIRGTTLEVSFRLTVKARVRMIARRGRKVVAKTQFRTLSAGNHRLLLVLNRRRWPNKLELQSRALAPLPVVSQ